MLRTSWPEANYEFCAAPSRPRRSGSSCGSEATIRRTLIGCYKIVMAGRQRALTPSYVVMQP
jgi:hypothetical protein